jgi:hypothetical protein
MNPNEIPEPAIEPEWVYGVRIPERDTDDDYDAWVDDGRPGLFRPRRECSRSPVRLMLTDETDQ